MVARSEARAPAESTRVVLLVCWGASRGLIALLTVMSPDWLGYGGNADVTAVYATWHSLLYDGLLPWRDFPVEYPIGVLPLLALPGGDAQTYAAWFLAIAATADLAVLGSLLVARRMMTATGWVVLPLALGPLFWGRFDVFVAASLAGIAVAARRRHYRAALLLAVFAGLLKLWPMLLAAPILRACPGPDRRRLLGTAAGTGAAVLLASWIAGFLPGQKEMLEFHANRGLEVESFWALPLLLVSTAADGIRITQGPGSFDVRGPGSWVLLTLSSVATTLGVAAWLLWVVKRHRRDLEGPIAVLVLVVLLGGKVLSAQYLAWLICAGVLVLDRARDRTRLCVALAVSGLTAQLTLVDFTPFQQVTPATPVVAALHALGLGYAMAAVAGSVRDGERAGPDAPGTGLTDAPLPAARRM